MSPMNQDGTNGRSDSIVRLRGMLTETRETLEDIADGYALVGNSTRLSILWLLDRGPHKELCPCDLAGILGITVPGVSQQLQRLRRGKLVRNRRDGKTIYYGLTDAGRAVVERPGPGTVGRVDAPRIAAM